MKHPTGRPLAEDYALLRRRGWVNTHEDHPSDEWEAALRAWVNELTALAAADSLRVSSSVGWDNTGMGWLAASLETLEFHEAAKFERSAAYRQFALYEQAMREKRSAGGTNVEPEQAESP